MKLIKYIGKRLNKNGNKESWGLYLCPFCLKEIEKRLGSERHKSCGCVKNKLTCIGLKGKSKSNKHKQNISKSLKGKKKSEEHLKNMSKALKGKKRQPHSEETKQKISLANKGKISSNKGKILSEEHKQKIRDSEIGKIVSEETRQKQSKARIGKYFGEESPNWQGGKSFEKYGIEFNSDLKQQILERDNYLCQCPDCEHKTDLLDVHHIDYDKKNNTSENLVTLCDFCHAKTNGKNKRPFWTEFYQNIIINRIVECLL